MWSRRRSHVDPLPLLCVVAGTKDSGKESDRMKKPLGMPDEAAPLKVRRADIAPTAGFALVVDRHYKTEYEDESAAKVAAAELLGRFPMLYIEIYDADKRTRAKFS
jgi:hypothetical protein